MTREAFHFGEPEWKSHPFVEETAREVAEPKWLKRLYTAVSNMNFVALQEEKTRSLNDIKRNSQQLEAVYEVARSLGMVNVLGVHNAENISSDVEEKLVLNYSSVLALAWYASQKAAVAVGDIDLQGKSRQLRSQPLAFQDWVTRNFLLRIDFVAVYATLSNAMGRHLHDLRLDDGQYQEGVVRNLIERAEKQNDALTYFLEEVDGLEQQGLDGLARYFGLFHFHLRSFLSEYEAIASEILRTNRPVYENWIRNYRPAFTSEHLQGFDIPAWVDLEQ